METIQMEMDVILYVKSKKRKKPQKLQSLHQHDEVDDIVMPDQRRSEQMKKDEYVRKEKINLQVFMTIPVYDNMKVHPKKLDSSMIQ